MTNPQSLLLLIGLAVVALVLLGIFFLVAEFKVYKKANKPGWSIFIPVYNVYVLAGIGDKPLWWGIAASIGGLSSRSTNSLPLTVQIILGIISAVSFVFYLLICVGVAKNFGRSGAFGVFLLGFLPFIGFSILGYGKSDYKQQPRDIPQGPPQPLTFPQA